jgi:Rho termination factor, N-terminal domain
MADEPRKDVSEMTVAELRARASELKITGRSSMSKAELRQAIEDVELWQPGNGEPAKEDAGDDASAPDGEKHAGDDASAPDGEKPASEITAPSIGPNTVITKEPPEERLSKHEQSDVDAMGLDKRRGVVGEKYGASFAKQATVYGVFLAVVAALLIGGKLAADELDQGPAVNEDKAPWAQGDAEQRPPDPIDFPKNPSP